MRTSEQRLGQFAYGGGAVRTTPIASLTEVVYLERMPLFLEDHGENESPSAASAACIPAHPPAS
jgi:hypothetical protein